MKEKVKDASIRVPTPREIFAELDRSVIGQDRAKRVVAIAAYNHLKRVNMRATGDDVVPKKSNILMIGPTGCGKTHIARNLARILDLPFTVVDATEYTEAGYYGKDVEVMIAELLYKAELNVELAQKGIIFVDEVDKIARRSSGARTGAGSRDIGGEGVQQGLLKLLEGQEVFVPLNVTQHWNKHDFTLVDTTDILFICAGTFSDLKAWDAGGGIGFMEESANRQARVEAKDLMEYGILAEFLGRLPVIVTLNELNPSEIKRIITDPPDSILREYEKLLEHDGVKLKFGDDALDAVVSLSFRRKLGARGLRTIFEEVMHDVMFEAPERAGETIVVDGDYVRNRVKDLF